MTSPRFKVTPDGVAVARRRPVITACGVLATVVEWADGQLDMVPSWEYDGERWRLYRSGGWGCRMHFCRLWDPLDEVARAGELAKAWPAVSVVLDLAALVALS